MWVAAGFVGIIVFGVSFALIRRRKAPAKGLQRVPEVGGWLPILGHFLQIRRDCPGFLQRCSEKYGDIFTIRFGSTKVAVVADREGGKAFFKANETNLSAYKLFDETGIQQIFFKEGSKASLAVGLFMRQNILSRPDEYVDAMDVLMEVQVRKLKASLTKNEKPQKLNAVVQNTLQQAVLHSVLGVEPTKEMMDALDRHLAIGRYTVLASYFLPRRLLNFIVAKVLCPSRDRTIKHFLPAVIAHTTDNKFTNSLLIRTAADKQMDQLGDNVEHTPEEICGILLVTYISMEIVGTVTTQILKELSKRPKLWLQLRNELKNQSTLGYKTLEACIMEAARLNANAMAIQRSAFQSSTLGGYDLAGLDQVSIVGTALFDAPKQDVFDPNEFWPERFLDETNKGLNLNGAVWFWGGGSHLCPGKSISINILQRYLSKIIRDFNVEFISASSKTHIFLNTGVQQSVFTRFLPYPEN